MMRPRSRLRIRRSDQNIVGLMREIAWMTEWNGVGATEEFVDIQVEICRGRCVRSHRRSTVHPDFSHRRADVRSATGDARLTRDKVCTCPLTRRSTCPQSDPLTFSCESRHPAKSGGGLITYSTVTRRPAFLRLRDVTEATEQCPFRVPSLMMVRRVLVWTEDENRAAWKNSRAQQTSCSVRR